MRTLVVADLGGKPADILSSGAPTLPPAEAVAGAATTAFAEVQSQLGCPPATQ
jgi:hypothetical protein